MEKKLNEEIELQKEIIEEIRALRNTVKELNLKGYEQYYEWSEKERERDSSTKSQM